MIVDEVMTRNPYRASATASIRQVMRMLVEADVRHIPIVDGDELVGIVSDRDFRSVAPILLEDGDIAPGARKALSLPISSLMSSDVLSVYPESNLVEVIDLMIEQKIGAVPVVDPDSSRLVGIVSYVDALRAARDVL